MINTRCRLTTTCGQRHTHIARPTPNQCNIPCQPALDELYTLQCCATHITRVRLLCMAAKQELPSKNDCPNPHAKIGLGSACRMGQPVPYWF
jgi:hypothetical protein